MHKATAAPASMNRARAGWHPEAAPGRVLSSALFKRRLAFVQKCIHAFHLIGTAEQRMEQVALVTQAVGQAAFKGPVDTGFGHRHAGAADKLLAAALEAAAAICALSGPSVAMAKACVNRAFEGSLSDGLSYERHLFHSLFGSADQVEGMDAFLNKRKPAFKQG